MDFDDLDDQIEQRLADGEEVVGYVRENNQPRPGSVLPLMKRSNRMPDFHYLPEPARKKLPPLNGEPEPKRAPVLRLLCVHGVADSYQQDWANLELEAPLSIEVGMHEFPGHGHREKEEILGDVDELTDDAFEAFKEAMDTGSFAFFGHSIGCLIVTKLAKRAKEELGVEPVQVFMVERGAPQFPLFTEPGYKILKEEPIEFMKVYQPIALAFMNAGELGVRTLNMWQRGWFVENQTLEEGYYTFNCPLLAVCAEDSVRPVVKTENLDGLMKVQIEAGGKYFNKFSEDGETAFCGHFPRWTLDEWKAWTEFKDLFKNIEIYKSDHMTIKAKGQFKTILWDTLQAIIKKWSAADG